MTTIVQLKKLANLVNAIPTKDRYSHCTLDNNCITIQLLIDISTLTREEYSDLMAHSYKRVVTDNLLIYSHFDKSGYSYWKDRDKTQIYEVVISYRDETSTLNNADTDELESYLAILDKYNTVERVVA